jgi:hypothetical protein
VQKRIAEYANKEKSKEIGVPYEELKEKYPEEWTNPGDVNIESVSGKMLYKMTSPKMVNIITRKRDGRNEYYHVPDPGTLEIFKSSPDLAKNNHLLTGAFGILGAGINPLKRIVTRSIPFAAYNTFYRDAATAMMTGRGSRSLVPFLYLAKGIKAMYAVKSGKPTAAQQQAVEESYEILSGGTTPTDILDSFTNMLKEGITRKGDKELKLSTDYNPSVVGWGAASKNWTGAAASVVLKPLDAVNWATGGWWLSPRGEALTRIGSALDAAEQGYSTEQAVLTADNSTANFHQRSISPTLNLIDSQAMFLNARLQVGWQFWRQIFHYDPHVRGLAVFKLAYGSAIHAAMIAGVVLALRTLGDDELDKWLDEWLKRENERTDEDKSRMGSLPLPGGLSLRIPFDDGLPGAFNSLGYNMALTMLAGDKSPEENKRTAAKIIARSTSLGGIDLIGQAMNPVVRTVLETQINLRLYDLQRIIPEGIASIPYDKMKYTPSTPTWYVNASETLDRVGLDVSPMMIKHIMSNVGFKTVDQAIAFFDKRSTREWSNAPIIGSLLTREPRGFASQSVKTVGEFDAKFSAAKKEYESAVESGDQERAELEGAVMMSLSGYRENWRAIERLWTAAKQLKNAGKPEEALEMERAMTNIARKNIAVAAGIQKAVEEAAKKK